MSLPCNGAKADGSQPSKGKNQYFLLKARERTMYENKTLICKDCGEEFIFTAGEQEFYA